MAAFGGGKKRSDESTLADAEAAREEERTEGADWSPKERLEHLPDELADSPVKKRLAGDEEAAGRAYRMIEALTSTVQSLVGRLERLESVPSRTLQAPHSRMKCGTCHQATKDANSRGICDGQHVMVRVVPKMMDMWESFQGVTWNGVKYAGVCMLPASIVDSVLAQIGRWEDMERQKHIPRGRNFGEYGDVSQLVAGRTPII